MGEGNTSQESWQESAEYPVLLSGCWLWQLNYNLFHLRWFSVHFGFIRAILTYQEVWGVALSVQTWPNS